MSSLSAGARAAVGAQQGVHKAAFALLSGLLLVLAAPGFDLGWLAWIALVPLLSALRGVRPHVGFGLGYLTGLGFFCGAFYWVTLTRGVGWSDFMLLGLYLAGYVGVFGAALALVSRRSKIPLVLSAPVIWVALELARSQAGFLALPMNLLAHSQYQIPALIQLAGFLGDYGLSFLLVAVNAAVLELLRGEKAAVVRATSVAILVTLALFLGYRSLDTERSDNHVTVAVIQGNIAQELKWKRELRTQHMAQHVRLSEAAAARGRPELIVWPESAVAGYLYKDAELLTTVTTLARGLDTHLLVGSSQRPKAGTANFRRSHSLNTAYLVGPSGQIDSAYHKLRLIPFVEYLPLRGTVPWPERLRAGAGNFVPGSEHSVMLLGKRRFATVICWESIFPEHLRQFRLAGAEFMVNIGNEAWFGDSAAAYQFLAANVFRAVENRVAVARAVNTGISGFIDPYGRIVDTVRKGDRELFVEGFSTLELPIVTGRSVYVRFGHWFAHVVVLAAVALLVLALRRGAGE